MDVVLSAVRTAQHPVTSSEIYEMAELDSKSTVYSTVNALLKKGSLIVAGERDSDRPKPGQRRTERLYAISPDAVELDQFDHGEPEPEDLPTFDIDAELANALKSQPEPDPHVITNDWPDAVEDQPERADPLRVKQHWPLAEPDTDPRVSLFDAHASGDPILMAIDRLEITPRIQGAANDSAVLYRLADKIGEIGNNQAADIAARLCEIASKLEAAA